MSDNVDELQDDGEGVYSFTYLVEVAGPSDLLERYPFGTTRASSWRCPSAPATGRGTIDST